MIASVARALGKRAATVASLVKLAHTIFAAPFAVAAMLLATRAPHEPVTIGRVIAIGVCLVSARTAAMAYNRLVDRDIDRENPRTKDREIPRGAISATATLGITGASCAIFLIGAAALGRTTAMLALPVLVVLLGYSHAKRFTWAAHLWLGVALGLAPGGAWLAMGGIPGFGILALMAAVTFWVAGFDVLYSLQDESFDRRVGLHSIPSRFGTERAVLISRALHVLTIVCLTLAGRLLGGGVFFGLGVLLIAGLLWYEHQLLLPVPPARGIDLRRLDKAFFDVNGWVSLGFLALVALDVAFKH